MKNKDIASRDLFGNMVILLIPLLFTNLLNSLTYIVDGIWVGNLIGENGISAIANNFPVTLFISAISNGFALATCVLVSHYYGANAKEKIKKVVGFAYISSIMLGILIAAIAILPSTFWLWLLHTPDVVFRDARTYLILYAIASMFNHLLFVIIGALRGIGNTKIPLVFVGMETILNAIMVPVLIIAGLGVAGVGLSVLISTLITMTIAITYINTKSELLRISKTHLTLDMHYLKEISKVGVPVIAEQWLIAALIMFETHISNISGVSGSATYGVVARLEGVILIIGMSFQTVAMIMVGQSIGGGKTKEMYKILVNGLKLAVIPTLVIFLFVFVLPIQTCSIFLNSKEIIKMATSYLSIVGYAYVLIPIRLLINGIIAGTGNTRYTFLTNLIASFCEITIILALLNVYKVGSLVALGLGILTWMVVNIMLNAIWFISSKKQKEVLL